MGLRDLVFENKDKKTEKKEEKISFPSTAKSEFDGTVTTPTIVDEAGQFDFGTTKQEGWKATPLSCEPHIETVMEMYEKGFDSLNKEGYDFYEYYKAILAAGINNAPMYNMALTMAKAMDSSVSKETLLSQSDYYLTEIEKVHQHYTAQGKNKKSSINTQKGQEESTLRQDLAKSEEAFRKAQQDINTLKSKIAAIDNKYAVELNDIDCKLKANDVAKAEIVNTINKVKQGINTNI